MFLRKRRNIETVIFKRFKKEPVKKEAEVKTEKAAGLKLRKNTKKESKAEITVETPTAEEIIQEK